MSDYVAWCVVCGHRKMPVGRSVPMEMAGSGCTSDCPGYYDAPRPPYHWPGEECTPDSLDPSVCLICRERCDNPLVRIEVTDE